MPPSKRNRGKQRQDECKVYRERGRIVLENIATEEGKTITILCKGRVVVDAVRRGQDEQCMFLLKMFRLDHEPRAKLYAYLLEEGLIPAILGLLNRCDEDLADVMDSLGGNIASPSCWLLILGNIVSMSMVEGLELHCAHIAKNIGPVVKCLCNDQQRAFFREKAHWHSALGPFLLLVEALMQHDAVISIMLEYEGFLDFTIQKNFWGSERPEILDEERSYEPENILLDDLINSFNLNWIIRIGHVKSFDNYLILERIGSTPIVSREYDPDCKDSFVVGLIRHLKVKNNECGIIGYCRCCPCPYLHLHDAISTLICDGKCVDKYVINEYIDFGSNFTSTFQQARRAVDLVENMFCDFPRDYCAATLFRAGLIEMCLHFLSSYLEHQCYSSLVDAIGEMLSGLSFISMHRKCSKALIERSHSIRSALATFHKKANLSPTNIYISLERFERGTKTDYWTAEDVSDIITFILDTTMPRCCHCFKTFQRSKLYCCARCKRQSYCSSHCQQKDWFYHKHRCKDVASQVEAATMREIKNRRILESNILMAGGKIFIENANYIAKALDAAKIDIDAAEVHIDLTQIPSYITVSKRGLSTVSAESTIESRISLPCMITAYDYNGKQDAEETRTISLHTSFPAYLIPNKSCRPPLPSL